MGELQDIVSTVAGLQARAWPQWLAALAVLVLGSLLLIVARPRLARWLSGLWWLAVGAAGVQAAWKIKWLADDAFISFAYARRWAEGDGLVLNPGERVEGYTNFLWTLMLGFFGRAGFDIPRAGLFLSIASWLVLSLAALALSLRRTQGLILPLAALAVVFTRPFFTFGTSGLESSFALALAAWAVVAWRASRPMLSSVLFALAALARPDHILLAGAVWLVAGVELFRAGGRLRALVGLAVRLALPTLLIFAVYWLVRWRYYGEFFPNTFYAKSGGGSYFSQGLVYATHAFATSGLWVALPLLGYGLWATRHDEERRPVVLLAAVVALTHGLYVLRVGGDFMEFRFLLPTFFFLLLAVEEICAPWLAVSLWSKRVAWVPLVCVGWAFLALNVRPIGPWEKKWHLAAEDTFYQLSAVYPEVKVVGGLQDLGVLFHQLFGEDGRKIRVATGCIGMVAYYGGIDVVDVFGLASRAVAHQPLLARGRPGHERTATLDSLLEERADISEGSAWPGRAEDLKVWLDGGRAYYVVRWSPELEALLRKHRLRAPDVEALIQRDLQAFSREELAASREFYGKFLAPSLAPAVLARFDKAMSGSVLDGVEAASVLQREVGSRLRQAEGLGRAELAQALRERVVFRLDFEGDGGAPPEEVWKPVEGALGDQQPIHGRQGQRLINTYHSMDASTGRLEIRLPATRDGLLDLLVGGGSDCAHVSATLFDGPRQIQRWCGVNDEVLRRVTLPIGALAEPRLVLIDESQGGWGHLLVDDVMVVVGELSRDAGSH